jgi:anti-repressor protein
MFILTISQAKQVLLRESKFVRKAIINYLEVLEEKLKKTQLPQTYLGALKALVVIIEEKGQLKKIISRQSAEIEFIDRIPSRSYLKLPRLIKSSILFNVFLL